MMTFHEYVDREERVETAKAAILNALGATTEALDDPVANFKTFRRLLDRDKNPQLADLIATASNRDAVVNAVRNAAVTKLSIADLVALFRAGLPADK